MGRKVTGSERRGFGSRLKRWLLTFGLLPLALGETWALVDVLGAASGVGFWIPVGTGISVWLVIFFSLPRPMWLYVVGHELTHVLWALLFGGRVRSFKASRTGGYVILSKTNSLIALAPYFFPLYTALWVGGLLGVCALVGWQVPVFWMHFGFGVAYAFHVTLTVTVLRVRQPDLEGEGWLFSAVLIWLLHGMLLLLMVPLLLPGTGLFQIGQRVIERVGDVGLWLVQSFSVILPKRG